jgi:chemotaxis signal transduction protein
MMDDDETDPQARAIPEAGGSSVELASLEVVDDPPVSRLVFQVAGQGLLYDQRSPMEYFESQTLFRIPTRHPIFRGLINRRGALVPVFDIGMLLNAQARLSDHAPVLVLGKGDDAAGLILDTTPYRVSISRRQKEPPPVHLTQVFGPHLGDCFQTGGQYVADVDLQDFLNDLVEETN